MSGRLSTLPRRLAGWLLLAACAGAMAQAERDPTQAPARPLGAASAAGGAGAGGASALDGESVMVIVREGRPFLVVGTRLYGQGQSLGSARIERISETEVWLREGKTLTKKPIFAGVVRRPAAAAAPASAPAPAKCPETTKKKPPRQARAATPDNCPP